MIEDVLLDISIDVQNELLRQCKRAECDDYQTDLINENTIAVFNLNKQKYIERLTDKTVNHNQILAFRDFCRDNYGLAISHRIIDEFERGLEG